MYDFYLDKTLLPVAPSTLTLEIVGKNKTVSLINEGEINLLKKAGLTKISFTVLLPNAPYHFSRGSQAKKTLDALERLKTRTDADGKLMPFQFIVSRVLPNATVLFETDIKVSLENYKPKEDAKNGFDTIVDISLKQYKTHGTKKINVNDVNSAQYTLAASIETQRPAENAPIERSHTVIKGDSLWAIAKKHLGDGNRYAELYAMNKELIDTKNAGTGNLKYTIYPGQILLLPFWEGA